MSQVLKKKLKRLLGISSHPNAPQLIEILAGKTSLSSSGYPYISGQSFQMFLLEIPHLFAHGERLLGWLLRSDRVVQKRGGLSIAETVSVGRSIKVLQTVVQTAGICAPSDLWVLRRILEVHKAIGTTEALVSVKGLLPSSFCGEKNLNEQQLLWDLSFLIARGVITRSAVGVYRAADGGKALELLTKIEPLPAGWTEDLSGTFSRYFAGTGKNTALDPSLAAFLKMPRAKASWSKAGRLGKWTPSLFQVECGFRLVTVVLALARADLLAGLKVGASFVKFVPRGTAAVPLLRAAGMIGSSGRVSQLGARVFERASGPMGIIYAYHPYFRALSHLLHDKERNKARGGVWVDRGANVAASQSANRKTFEMANDAIDSFCKDSGFSFSVFIEHALGQGEATRQRFERDRTKHHYFGADLEDAAIDRAVAAQAKGQLPREMCFIRSADIGRPELVVNPIREARLKTSGAVMVVGNGFHEVRGQSDEKIIAVFRGYCEAGILLIFTEESQLSDRDLIATGWNTYHAGFRYTHNISGQGLRAASGVDDFKRLSWPRVAEAAGYVVLKKYSTRTRTIYPHPRPRQSNPPISMNYFCVPADLFKRLEKH